MIKKKTIVLFFILILFIERVFSINLAILSLDDASLDELNMMCDIRGIEDRSSKSSMINALKDQFFLEYGDDNNTIEISNIEELQNALDFSITNCEKLSILNQNNSIVILENNVELFFSEDDIENTINAQKVIIDIERKQIVALVDVFYSNNDENNTSFSQTISGDLIKYDWSLNKLQIINGSISIERENSDADSVTFYSKSSEINIDSINNTLQLTGGFLTTNLNNSYFSISAQKIALLKYGDMYFEGAKISIGRVNILYLPFFFSPGATMSFNPSIGYESTRGSFINTTYEVFGKYPSFEKQETNSFNTLLKSSDTEKYVDGAIYKEDETKDEIQSWAEDTDSYLTLMLDAYEKTPYSINNTSNGSVVASFVSELNLINEKLKINTIAITSIASDGVNQIDDSNDYPIFRYNVEHLIEYNYKYGNLKAYIPILSDPAVKKAYANRLSTFNIDALWNKNQTFPTKYLSDISNYTLYAQGDFKYDFKYINPFVSEIDVSKINSSINYGWNKVDGIYKYEIETVTIADINAKIKGVIVDSKSEKDDKTNSEDSKENTSEKNEDLSIIDKLYSSNIKKDSSSIDNSFIKIDYEVDNQFKDSFDSETNNDIYNQSNIDFNMNAALEPNYISLNSNLNIKNIYDEDEKDAEIDNTINISTTNIVSFEKINLNYYLNSTLYNYKYEKDDTSETTTVSNFELNDDFISKHELELIDTYNLYDLKISPSLNLVLPPLDWQLKPSIKFQINNISNKSVFSFDIGSNNFNLIKVQNYFSLNYDNLNLQLDFDYDIEEYTNNSNILDPLEVNTSITFGNKKAGYIFSHTNTFYGLYDDLYNNYFSKFNFSFKNDFLTSKLNFYTDNNELKLDYLKNTITFNDIEKYWWKNRIGLNLDFSSTFNYSYSDIYSTYFSLESTLQYRIAEFLEIEFNIKTSNHGFHTYYINNQFDFTLMFDDLLSSFDIFNGGNKSTQFNLETISLELVHMMEDWDLHCKYEGLVVLSNYNYQWVPSVSLYLQWKALPELKVDQSFTNSGDHLEILREAAPENVKFQAYTAGTLNNLGVLLSEEMGRMDEAEEIYGRALKLQETSLSPDHPQVAQTLNNLGLLYYNTGSPEKALALYTRALEIFEKLGKMEHMGYANTLNNLAGVYVRKRRCKEALELYEKTLAIREKLLGEEHPEVAKTLNNLAELYRQMGEHKKALPLYTRALKITEKSLGSEHMDVGTTLNNLAGLHESMDEYETASEMYERALGIIEKELGIDHPYFKITRNNLLALYEKMERDDR